jgi:hypothetical protein
MTLLLSFRNTANDLASIIIGVVTFVCTCEYWREKREWKINACLLLKLAR